MKPFKYIKVTVFRNIDFSGAGYALNQSLYPPSFSFDNITYVMYTNINRNDYCKNITVGRFSFRSKTHQYMNRV